MKSVVIIDDHDIVRYGLEMLIQSCPDLRVTGSAASLQEGLALIARWSPDLVVTDMSTGDSDGLETVRQVVQAQAPRAVVVVSMHDEILYGERALALGAGGYVMKEAAHATLIEAARAALDGQAWASPRLAGKMIRRTLRHSAAPAGEPEPLTPRELEILGHLKTGRTTKEIAYQMGLSVRTVDIHRSNIKRKLRLRTGAELIAYAATRL